MRSRRPRGIALGAAIAAYSACAAGCEAVPDIHFVEDEAGAPRIDAGSDGPETGVDAAPTSCVTPSPGPGATCCGTVWCTPGVSSTCTPASCAECEKSACQTGELCCARPQGALCKKTCQ